MCRSVQGRYRTEQDALGSKQVPVDSLTGIHAARALENFPLTNRCVHPELVKAYGVVKLARQAKQTGKTVREVVLDQGVLDEKSLADLISPEAVNRLGRSRSARTMGITYIPCGYCWAR